VKVIHDYCNSNRRAIIRYGIYCCFYCRETYASQQVDKYVDNNTCVLCPKCGIDSVLSDTNLTSYQLTVELLKNMHGSLV
jgi:NAD-dependent SIR2 family protein deacetylase